jgi:hypothetical protein
MRQRHPRGSRESSVTQNIVVSPSYLALRAMLTQSLAPFHPARAAVVKGLEALAQKPEPAEFIDVVATPVIGTSGARRRRSRFPTGQEHFPEVQTWPVPQAVPQAPQWFLLVAVLTQTSPPGATVSATGQITFPAGQEHLADDPGAVVHSSPRMQIFAQLPQRHETPSTAASLLRFAQTLPGQSTFPVGHIHCPEKQV